jgi:hypothetical protein
MIPGDRFHNQRCYHHKDFHRSHHSHSNSASDGVSIQKSGTREIKVVRRVLDVNDKMAEQNRRLFAEKGIFVLNVMSSPGSGKTTTLEKTLAQILPEIKSAVIVTWSPMSSKKRPARWSLMISNFWSLKMSEIWYARPSLISARIPAW